LTILIFASFSAEPELHQEGVQESSLAESTAHGIRLRKPFRREVTTGRKRDWTHHNIFYLMD
jgi:hypothetical protein